MNDHHSDREDRPDHDHSSPARETDSTPDASDYSRVIAPLPDYLPWSELEVMGELLAGVYAHGAELAYHEYVLTNVGDPEVGNVWYVGYPTETGERLLEYLNLAAFRDVTALQTYLDELVAVGPSCRGEWLDHRRATSSTHRRGQFDEPRGS